MGGRGDSPFVLPAFFSIAPVPQTADAGLRGLWEVRRMRWLCPHDRIGVLVTGLQGAPSAHAREVAVGTLATRQWALTGLDWLAPRAWASCLECEKKICCL